MSNEKVQAAENSLNAAIDKIRESKGVNVEIVKDPPKDIEVVIDDGPKEVAKEPPKEDKKEPRRSQFVQTDDPVILERINDLYSQAKKSDAKNQQLIQHNEQLEKKLSELYDRFEQTSRETKDAASDKVESDLKMKLREARELENHDLAVEIEEKLIDLKLERRLSNLKQPEKKPQEEPKKAPSPQEQLIVHNAAYIEHLAQEKDQQGNLVRPYLWDWHPDNQKAVELLGTIPAEFKAAGKQPDLKTIMDVIDERISPKASKKSTTVLNNDESTPRDRTTVKLTEEQVYVAKRMGITPEAYARQVKLLSQKY